MTMRGSQKLHLPAVGVLSVLLVAAAFLARPTDARAAVSYQDSIEVLGQRRTFTIFAPDGGASGTALPIFIVLHGGLGNGVNVARDTGLVNYVDRNRFIAVFPDANGKQWNDGRRTTAGRSDDVAFLRSLIATVVQRLRGDPTRVFVAGVSNGGMMAQRMACDASDIVTAVGSVVANMPADLIDHCRPSRPIPIVMFNGTSDRLMPWSGGSIPTSRLFPGGAGGEVVSTMDTFNFWAQLDGCGRPVVNTLSGTRVKRYTTSCRGKSDVTLYEIDGGGHGWPGGNAGQGPFARLIVGYVTNDISASSILIDFFAQHGL